MVPDLHESGRDDAALDRWPTPDGGAAAGFDQTALYRVVHAAVKDALLDVIGTLVLVGISFVFVAMGGQMLLSVDLQHRNRPRVRGRWAVPRWNGARRRPTDP